MFMIFLQVNQSWLPGILTKGRGPLAFMIKLDNGRVVHQHADHIRDCVISVPLSDNKLHTDGWADDLTPTVSNAPLFLFTYSQSSSSLCSP